MANPFGSMGPHVLLNRNRGNRQNDQDFLDNHLVPIRQLFQAQKDWDCAIFNFLWCGGCFRYVLENRPTKGAALVAF
jgi:hypothetical protein